MSVGTSLSARDFSVVPFSASASTSLATKLTLPETLPEDAPTLYRWTGVVMATAAE